MENVLPNQASFDLDQLATALRCSIVHLRRAIWAGHLLAYRIGKKLVVSRADAVAYAERANTRKPIRAAADTDDPARNRTSTR